MVAYFGRGGYPQRAPGEVLVRDSRQAAEGAPLHSRLPPGVERRLLGSSHQGEEGQRRRGRRMGDQSPVRSPPRRRRVAGPERGSSSGHYGQPQPKEKGSRRRCGKEGREEEEEARQVPEKEQKAKPFQAGGQEEEGEGPQQRSRRQRFRPGPQQTEEGDAESSKVGEEGQEKRELLLNWEFRQGGNALHRVFQRDGRFRCFWSNQDGQKDLDKVFLQYFRAQLAAKMQPAMRREALHASFCLDLGLQGRIPELLDILAQRLKALEGQAGGKHWTVTSQYELVPEEMGAVATSMETERAAKEARELGRLKALSARPYGSSQATDRWEDWKKDGSKGKPSKGSGKGKDWRRGDKGDGKDSRGNREVDNERDRNKGK